MPTLDQLRTLETQIAPAALAGAQRTGIPAEVLCAQCILESGWLAHAPGKNCFGIKYYFGAYGRQLLKACEWFTMPELTTFLSRGDGRTAEVDYAEDDSHVRAGPPPKTRFRVQDWFATFPTLADCFTRRALLFTEGRYGPAARAYRETANLEAFVRAIAPIYATDPHYADAVLVIARSEAVLSIIDRLWTSISSFEK